MVPETEPLVSVIIPFFNREDLTLLSINSVFNQTYNNYEIILIDDGSTETIDQIKGLNNSKIQLLYQIHKGPAAARNFGMKNARGKYIAFLDSDDIFLPEKLNIQVEIHEKHPDIWLSHTSYQKIDQNGSILGITNSGTFSGFVFPNILLYCPIATPTVMINRKIVDNLIFYDDQYKISEDIIFYAKVAKHSEIIGIDIPLSNVRISECSHSTNTKSQIAGYNNILKFIRKKTTEINKDKYREINCTIRNYMAMQYYLNGSFIYFLINSFLTIHFSKQKIKTTRIFMKMIRLAFGTKLGIIKKSG